MAFFLTDAQIEEMILPLCVGQQGGLCSLAFVDVDRAAAEAGLWVVYEQFEDAQVLGFLSDGTAPVGVLREGRHYQIVFAPCTVVLDTRLKAENKQARRRFTLAHEVGHHLLNRLLLREGQGLCCARCEYLANKIAAALLMPQMLLHEWVLPFLQRRGLAHLDISLPVHLAFVKQVAAALGVSMDALLLRLFDCALLKSPVQKGGYWNAIYKTKSEVSA